ncbi:TetR/AcrR family transcriptional regulator [uncultured Roseobacter sp.]|uniref:TetR/AcrR family transcriptional regulator n=1 Tax=uncultured Roseobacter sp. TaxID=114847 RepID=UPI0026278CDB|nr:TetR/AcrR family transcriptional regulator [uncultured Roseobacter sp.]
MPRPSHKDKIIDAGLAVFHEFGYHASGVQTVVDHAGVPKGSFYNHFKSKDELGLEVLNAYWRQSEDMRAALRASDKSPLDRIDDHLASFNVTRSGCLVGNFTSEMANEPQFRVALREVYASWIADFEACIAEGQNDGSIRNDETPKALAAFIVTALEGSVLKRKLEDDEQTMVSFRKTMLLFLRAG